MNISSNNLVEQLNRAKLTAETRALFTKHNDGLIGGLTTYFAEKASRQRANKEKAQTQALVLS